MQDDLKRLKPKFSTPLLYGGAKREEEKKEKRVLRMMSILDSERVVDKIEDLDQLAEICLLGPKKCYTMGLLDQDRQGWREGFTKPTLMSRKIQRRKNNKLSKKDRRKQRV